MTSRLDYLRAQRATPASVWLQFTQAQHRFPNDFFAFVEGANDVAYYLPCIRRYWSLGEVRPLVCDGKAAVLDVHRRAVDANRVTRAAFFVDKDVDDYLGFAHPIHNRLYVTECYSIENAVVTEQTFFSVWTELFHLDSLDPRMDQKLDLFRNGLRRFGRKMLVLMAWVVWQRRLGNRPLLDNIKLDILIEVDQQLRPATRLRQRRAYLESASETHSSIPCFLAVLGIARQLQGDSPKRYIRGKFELWYFVECVKRLLQELSARCSGNLKRAKCHVQFAVGNATELLAPRATVTAVRNPS